MPRQRPNKETNLVIYRIDRAQHARPTAMIVGIDRFAQPLQSKLDIVRLQMAPALDLGLISILRVTLEVFSRELLRPGVVW
jgi:hypothetical protein